MLDQTTIYSVHDINKEVGKTLLRNYSSIWIKGEISNYKEYPSGHTYFVLKDKHSQISCVLFATYQTKEKQSFNDGDQVTILGNITLYENRGQYQYQCLDIIKSGTGELWQQYLLLKNELESDGLFLLNRKIPKYPESIGIITSKEGSVIQDIFKIMKRRSSFTDIHIYDTKVQGESATYGLIRGIDFFNKSSNVELIIIARGGGSLEDLWCFNSKELALSIHSSKIPIISAVGHETDYTICDFAADYRAATPSEAVEIISENNVNAEQKVLDCEIKMKKIFQISTIMLQQKIENKITKLETYNPSSFIKIIELKIDNILLDMNKLAERYINEMITVLKINKNSIEGLNPKNILKKGYSIISTDSKNIISDVTKINVNDIINIDFYNGKANALVNEIKADNNG